MQENTLIKENRKRLSRFSQEYDPIRGIGSKIERFEHGEFFLPLSMKDDEDFILLEKIRDKISIEDYIRTLAHIRLKHDFEFWAATAIKIKDKKSGTLILFYLNEPQRGYVARLEKDRNNKKPIRIVLLKGRQWGGSTLTQLYAFWIQNIHHTYWNSVIVGDVEEQARNIRNMYTVAANNYPYDYGSITLAPFEGSTKNKVVVESQSVISIGSMQRPESLRSADLKIGHLSEVAFWKKTASKTPEDLIQSLIGTIPMLPDTMIVQESTAKGVGNYFHNVYIESKAGKTGYDTYFVSWLEFKDNMLSLDENEYQDFFDSFNEYELFLWNSGATLQGIKWYRFKLAEMEGNTWRMKSEFPSNEMEAFQSSGNRVFPFEYVDKMRKYNETPIWIGDFKSDGNADKSALDNITWHDNPKGNTKVWAMPEEGFINRYLVTVDIGGTTDEADWSVIRVFDRRYIGEGGKLEAILTCNLHQDVDIVAWKAAAIAKKYDNALLVIEKNSMNRKKDAGENYLVTLEEIAEHYENVYKRQGKEDEEAEAAEIKYGFHTNKQTKPMIVKQFKAALREETYMERDREVLDEADIYEEKEDGSYGAVDGKGNHDDKLMTTMIGVHISTHVMEICKKREIKQQRKKTKPSIAKF